jgi:hypothetical protein
MFNSGYEDDAAASDIPSPSCLRVAVNDLAPGP